MTESSSNPNFGKMPVTAATWDWMAEHTPEALKGVYNMNDQRAELLWRVNAWVQGRFPGEPVNWAGLRGFK